MSRRRLVLVFSAMLAALFPVLPESGAQQTEGGTDRLPARSAAGPSEVRPLAADRDLLRRSMVEARVATDRSRPGLTLWAQDAGLAFSRWAASWMERVVPGFNRWFAPFVEPALTVLLALLAAVLLVLLARFALGRWRQRAPATTSPAIQHLGDAGGRPAYDWESELARHLESGDVAAAIHALWWWLANGLAADRAEPSWTSRELVVRAGRHDLLAVVRRLDRMMYGAVRPRAGDVRRLWGDLREAV